MDIELWSPVRRSPVDAPQHFPPPHRESKAAGTSGVCNPALPGHCMSVHAGSQLAAGTESHQLGGWRSRRRRAGSVRNAADLIRLTPIASQRGRNPAELVTAAGLEPATTWLIRPALYQLRYAVLTLHYAFVPPLSVLPSEGRHQVTYGDDHQRDGNDDLECVHKNLSRSLPPLAPDPADVA